MMVAAEADRRGRLAARGATDDEIGDDPELRAIREEHAARLWDVLDDLEAWPGRGVVGEDGADAAWRIAQYAITDPELQRRCVRAMETAVDLGDASPVQHAFLVDRVRMSEGRPQLYGSQVVRGPDGTSLVAWPVDDVEAVDERRARLGLPPLAQHLAALRARH